MMEKFVTDLFEKCIENAAPDIIPPGFEEANIQDPSFDSLLYFSRSR